MALRLVSITLLTLLPFAIVRSAALNPLTVERIHAEPALDGPLPTDLAWHPDGRLTYLRPGAVGAKALLEAWDPSSGGESEGFAVVLAGATKGSTGAPEAGLPGYQWAPSGRQLLVSVAGVPQLIDVPSGNARALTSSPVAFPQFSPDGQRVAFVRDHDIYAVELRGGRETRLTSSGSPTVLNGQLNWLYEEELADRAGKGAFRWSPDSRSIAFLQLDEGQVPEHAVVDFLAPHGSVTLQRYPHAGERNPVVRLGVIALRRDGGSSPERFVAADPAGGYIAPQFTWTPDSRGVAFQQLDRAQAVLELSLVAVPESPGSPLGSLRPLLTERSSSWIDVLGAPRFLRDGRRFLWLSERSGFAHLQLCDATAGCRAMTKGPYVVERLDHVDERTGFAFFVANEGDARERHLYRVRFDGTGLARLTTDPGSHEPSVSPNGRYFADKWSSIETPPRLIVSSLDGTRRHVVFENIHPPALEYDRARPEWMDIRAADGTVLHGMLLKPSTFDPVQRYPLVVNVYGGPGVQLVRNAWSAAAPLDQLLASKGMLVWSLDNRGSAARGQAFEAALRHHLGDVELEDQLAGVAHLSQLPYVDPRRMGIYGWSYGGYLALRTVTRQPGLFRAAVAGAPVTDWRLYDTVYTERYMGTPEANPEGYRASSIAPDAPRLDTALLLIHGTADDNVHLGQTLGFIDALIRGGRPYSLVLEPSQRHSFRKREAMVFRDGAILRHFETNLLGR